VISAREALQLKSANISNTDMDDLKELMPNIEDHIRTKMTFSGTPPLIIAYKRLSSTAAKVLAHVMKRDGWEVRANLFDEQPRFAGAPATHHHWELMFAPRIDIYDDVLADIDLSSSQLVA
jgi:hypothetical protein